jgi:uncharacterized membrane protein
MGLSNVTMTKLFFLVGRMDSHHRLLIAIATTLLTSLLVPESLTGPTRIIIAWTVFALMLLGLIWISFLTVHPRQLPQLARLQDSSRTFLFVLVLGAAVGSLGTIVLLLTKVNGLPPGELSYHLSVSMLAVFCSWLLVHSLFSLRYAHLYYANTSHKGLDFPGTPEPDYVDFAYFSFIIGMTSQVSDVQITSSIMRRLALLHGMLSFIFNTIIIALTINIMASLLES